MPSRVHGDGDMPPKVVMKMDVESAEYAVLPDLAYTGVACVSLFYHLPFPAEDLYSVELTSGFTGVSRFYLRGVSRSRCQVRGHRLGVVA